jgi:site-specific DNA-adenine methylase
MPKEGNTYLEPFAGRANMFLLAKQNLKFNSWILNDKFTFEFLEQLQSIQNFDFIPETMTWDLFLTFKNKWEADRVDSQALIIEPGIAQLGHYRSGWMGKYVRTRPWNKTQYIERITTSQQLLKDVFLTKRSWEELKCDSYGEDDFIYFDPPYLDTEHRYYKDIDHKQFVEMLKSLKCRWLLSHTYHPLYVENLGEPLVTRRRKARGKCLGKVKGQEFLECLWSNY